jgi:hypothetical protein
LPCPLHWQRRITQEGDDSGGNNQRPEAAETHQLENAKAGTSAGGQAKGSPIVQRIDDLVAENASLRAANAELKTENTELKGLFGQIERSLGPVGRRSPRVAATATRSSIVRQKPRAAKKRARITNPGTIEKRRAALVKAREALAAKRAAKT